MSTFIFDELTGIPTILASNRSKRPDQTGSSSVHQTKSPSEGCLFCKGSEHLTPQTLYQDSDDWNVRVFKNKFPIVDDHELIVHSPDHDRDIETLSHEQVVKIVRALLNRVNYYTSKDMEVMIFNNKGGRAGASLKHPHSQIIALKGFPGTLELEKNKALEYLNEHTTCYWCDEVKNSREEHSRVVYETPHFFLEVPKASRWSYETMLIPKEHRPNFEYISEMEINDFAKILQAILYAYDKLLENPDRNFWIHTQRYDPYHWHVGFIPHTKTMGGLELGAGIFVSDKATPEEAAKKLAPYVKKSYEKDNLININSLIS
jgi:UDPglucose--hexose-1-phosphate uridylyltransferase